MRRVGTTLRVRTTDKPPISFRLATKSTRGRQPRAGDWVLFRRTTAGRGGKAQLVEVLGPPESPGVDLRVVMARYRFSDRFPAAVRRLQDELPQRIRKRDRENRIRFDSPDPVTIDGETAKDFDDAIAVESIRGGGFRLFVHIADVTHFVQPQDAIDIEARRRGTSVYFPGKVVPMLPETLSNDLCSLRPGVERLVQSVVIDFDARGERRKVRMADGVIRSAARLTYSQVSQVLAGGREVGVPARVVPMLQVADALRERLERQRQKRGSLDFDLPVPTVLLDVDGAVTGMTIEARNSAHRMIEEFMIAANEAVADYFVSRKRHALFRIHDVPEEDRVARLRETIHSLGMRNVKLPAEPSPRDLREVLDLCQGRPEAPVVAQMTLRSMKQARYSIDPGLHFGLATETYCHFTSPIRRYPDLINHRLLRNLRHRRKEPAVEPLERMAVECGHLERDAEAAERELLNWKQVAYIADHVGQRFEGVITGVVDFGLFVRLEESHVEGLIRTDELGPGTWVCDDRLQTLSADDGRRFGLGGRLQVKILSVDRYRNRVTMGLGVAPRRRRRRR